MSLPDYFWSHVAKTDSCWDWTGATSGGYGVSYLNSKKGYAHRISYQDAKGAIPVELELDHLCRNRACVNPDHLEAVTRRVNTRRGESPSALSARKTHCPQGHPYDEANTHYSPRRQGRTIARTCKICQLESRRRHNAKVRERKAV